MTTRQVTRAVLTLAAVALAARAPSPAGGQTLSWSGSLQFSRGEYIFTEPTRSFLLYNGLTYEGSRLRFHLGLPVVMQDSRAITYVGALPLPTGGPDHGAVAGKTRGAPVPMGGGRRHSGAEGASARVAPPIGLQTTDPPPDSVEAPGSLEIQLADPLISAGVELVRPRGAFLGLDLTGSMKLPLRDLESGVGTGEVDVGVGISTAAARGRLMVFGDVGWWRYGDLPELTLKDVITFGAGVGWTMGSSLSGLVSYSGSTQVMDAVDPPAEISGLLGYRTAGGTSISVGCGIGLSHASQDVSLSIGAGFTVLRW